MIKVWRKVMQRLWDDTKLQLKQRNLGLDFLRCRRWICN